MSQLFQLVFYKPLYNGLIFLFNIIPWADAGIIVIVFTVIVKLVLFPVSRKALRTQLGMQRLAPELEAIKEKHKDDSSEQARQTMALYKEKKVNPFSSLFLTLIQLPIIFALYRIFLHSGLPGVDGTLLYSFITVPQNINMFFLGLIDIAKKNVILALLAAASTFFQMKLSVPPQTSSKPKHEQTFKDNLAKSMSTQMKYFFPIIVFFISYNISGAIALYWFANNVFTIFQELFIRKQIKTELEEEEKILKTS